MAVNFVDCTSLNINYNIMGIATVSYTVVSDTAGFNDVDPVLKAGDQTFRGIITEASANQIPNTNWYETHVTMIATTD